ncbi:uncharacterized protein RHO17_016323 [Thomomys bottae]
MEFAGASMLASSCASKITAAVALAKAGGVASGTFLAGLSSQGASLLSSAAVGPAASTLGPLLASLNVSTLPVLSIGAKTAAMMAGGAAAVAVVAAVPVVLGTVGFTSSGIAASSIAAKMMSTAAIANGGGVAAGGLVATLQSVGASGLPLSAKILASHVGSALVAIAL